MDPDPNPNPNPNLTLTLTPNLLLRGMAVQGPMWETPCAYLRDVSTLAITDEDRLKHLDSPQFSEVRAIERASKREESRLTPNPAVH